MFLGEDTFVESIVSVEWVAQCPIYHCRVFGRDNVIKLKEKDIPPRIIEQFSTSIVLNNENKVNLGLFCVEKQMVTDGWTNRPTDAQTDGRTDGQGLCIGMLGRLKQLKVFVLLLFDGLSK